MLRNMKFIKKVIKSGGNRRNLEHVQTFARRYTDDQQAIELVTMLYHLLVYTNYLHPTVYEIWVMSTPVKRLAKKEKRSTGAIYVTVHRQKERLERLLPDDLFELIKNPELHRAKIDYYHMVLLQMNQRHKTEVYTSISRLFTFNIQDLAETDLEFNYHVTGEEFEAMVKSLQMTIRPYLDLALEEIDPRLFGYILYLLQGDKFNLTERDLARKQYMEESWLLHI